MLLYICIYIYISYAYVCIVNTFTLSASVQMIIVLFLPYFSQMVFLQLLLYLNTLLSYLLFKSKGSPLKKKYLWMGFNSYCSHPKMTYFDFSSTTLFLLLLFLFLCPHLLLYGPLTPWSGSGKSPFIIRINI